MLAGPWINENQPGGHLARGDVTVGSRRGYVQVRRKLANLKT
jgi:hypothetical protein